MVNIGLGGPGISKQMKTEDFVPQAIMLIGLPGSGKSTYIQKLKSQNPQRNYVVLSTDDIIELWGQEQGLNYSQAFAKFPFKQVERQFYRNFDQAIKDRKDVILDQTNLTVKSRARKLDKIPSDYEKVGVVFDVDLDEIHQRLVRRVHETGKDIPDHVVQNMIGSFQPPSKQEFDKIVKIT